MWHTSNRVRRLSIGTRCPGQDTRHQVRYCGASRSLWLPGRRNVRMMRRPYPDQSDILSSVLRAGRHFQEAAGRRVFGTHSISLSQGISRMDAANKNQREFVTRLGNQNREFYGRPEGRGILRAIELTYDQHWVYLYELVQNALDVGASLIGIRLTEADDALVFQHNGDRSFDDKDVEGLSKIFQSTKGARSVGFMGIGFKSVFIRFQEARISGWGWTFRYEIAQVVGEEFGDVQRDLLGAVVPIWDDEIAAPEPGFTTRFELRRRTDEGVNLDADLVQFLPDDNRAPLAILAMSGLERLEIEGRIWELGISEEGDGTFEAAALSEDENRLWRVFATQFQPSKEAIACFLEHRKIQPTQDDREQVYADASRPRTVLGVLPLDNEGIPAPPTRGRAYATLPTEVTLPFGLHVNADWLLNISRSDLREIGDNAWQRDIVNEIAEILARFLEWSASRYSQPDAAEAAFRVLGKPSSDAGGLEALLAEELWLSTLRDRIEQSPVFPVWTEVTGKLAYAKPGDTSVPPAPLAQAFRIQPELRPAVLLKARVLRDDVVGRKALGLLHRIGFLTEMVPGELERAWGGGLQDWWKTLPDDPGKRRYLLFHIWAALAALTADEPWRNLNVRCVRTVTGEWVVAGEAAYLNEPLPSEAEPGGTETRRLMQPFVPDANRLHSEWVTALRRPRQAEPERTILSQARDWIEDHAQSISLREIVEDALNALSSSTSPDWALLVSLGHWARYRNRADLLNRVLVRSQEDRLGIPLREALLADPYVDHGQERRRLFSEVPPIAADYLEMDPASAGAHKWRTFFEQAGAKGGLEVRPSEMCAGRWQPSAVADFLGRDHGDISESNDEGYRLLDFDVKPSLPRPGAPAELRAALAPWLQDGFGALKKTGRRTASYHYYERKMLTGTKASAWVEKLSALAWVPCNDGVLRYPGDVIRDFEPAREHAPFAILSPQFLSVLEKEGVRFGTTIPEATSLQELLAVGSQLDAAELAGLLSECRVQAATDIDRQLLDQALQGLRLPTSDSRRVTLDRIVQRVGGRLRGTLGGWVVPLERIDEILRTELEHVGFRLEFPETTTGGQALGFIRDVWKRARLSPGGLANEVRDLLPTAYAYSLDDCSKDASLLEQWWSAVPQAMVFGDREWIAVTGTDDIYLDDIEDRRFFPRQIRMRTVTAGHLGHSGPQQVRTAEELGLSLLSSCVTMEWVGGDERLPVSDDWAARFDCVYNLLQRVRGSESVECDDPDNEHGAERSLGLVHVDELALCVSVGNAAPERVPVNARLQQDTLTIAGRPLQFGADAAKELCRHFSFGQRAGLAADLTGMLMAIGDDGFDLAAEKFGRSHVPDFELSVPSKLGLGSGEQADSGERPPETAEITEPVAGAGTNRGAPNGHTPTSDSPEQVEPDRSGRAKTNDRDTATSEHQESTSKGGSYTKARALAKQNTLARQLKNSLKGEIVPDPGENGADGVAASNGDTDTSLGDEEYREVAAQYEREAGREPELGDPHQSGWDIRSIDPETQDVRLIEVKGRGRPWDDVEVVELSSAQVREAFGATDTWYLYVVEKTSDGYYQVLPIENPVRVAAKWILSGQSWRMMAEDGKAVTPSSNGSRSTGEPGRLGT